MKACSIVGCVNPSRTNGLCLKHYDLSRRETRRPYMREYRRTHYKLLPKRRALEKKAHIKYYTRLKLEVIKYYSNGTMDCACCGEKNLAFLSIDHINGSGKKHRKEIGCVSSGAHFYRWLITNNFPVGFQILCMNCNFAKGHNPYNKCPHELARIEAAKNEVNGLL